VGLIKISEMSGENSLPSSAGCLEEKNVFGESIFFLLGQY